MPTPTGPVKLTVPAGSQQGARLRLAGKGVERSGSRGDLYVGLEVRLPDQPHAGLSESARTAGAAYSRPVREGIKL